MAHISSVKMLLSILAILSVLHQAYPLETTEQKNQTCSFICNDDILTSYHENLDYLKGENEKLRLKLDTMNMVMNQEDLPSNCDEAIKQSGRQSGVHKIRVLRSEMEPFLVYCMADPNKKDAAWTIIQRRMDGSIDFFRNWVDYKQGFGNLEGEFMLGLDKIHALTQSSTHELWIKLEDFENATRSAYYSSFAIGGNSEKYAMNVLGSYSGDAGDSLRRQASYKFTTKDMDNDNYGDNCAVLFKGGWWYNDCHDSNLNGQYLRGAYSKNKFGNGVNWRTWHEYYYSLKYVHMAIRPVS